MGTLKRAMMLLAGRLGLFLLVKSRLFSGYFAPWRWAIFDRAQRLGVHILPVHYYSPIPNVEDLKIDDQTPKYFGVDAQTLDAATDDLKALAERYGDAYQRIADRPAYRHDTEATEFRFGLAPYTTLEAEVLYGLIRSRKPAQIIEIGSGHTTFLISEAIKDEADYTPTFECIEPYRPRYLKDLPSEVTVFQDTALQMIPLHRFEQLDAGDILFIDSSHIVGYGSDVVHEILSILPRLKPGVLVHFHDIFLPYEYPNDWVIKSKFFWNEQYMLAALVQDNPRYLVRYPLHQLYRDRSDIMYQLFPRLTEAGHRPGAFWLEILSAQDENTAYRHA